MGTETGISWCDATWNPWQGCTRVSEGCANCYMMRDKARFGQDGTAVSRSAPATFSLPLRKTRGSWKIPDGQRVFVCSWSDFFHPDADAWRDEAWDVMRQRPGLRFLILTKRPERIAAHLPSDWGEGWANVWLGVTAENQARANERIPILLNTPARVRFVSCEPLLGPVDLDRLVYDGVSVIDALDGLNGWPVPHASCDRLDWVIVGGESGPQARVMGYRWAQRLRNACACAGVPFFFKQWGAQEVGRLLDGREHLAFPEVK